MPRGHLAELVLDGAEVRDRRVELLAARRIPGGFLDVLLRAARAHRAELEAAEVQHVEGDLVALADFAEHRVRRRFHLLQNHRRRRGPVQSELVLFLAARHARPLAFDDERGEMLAVDLGEHDVDVGETAVGDPHLFAGDDVAAVSLLRCFRLGAERVRARAGFAQAIGADHLAGYETGQVLLFLLFGAEHVDRQDGEVCLRPEAGSE